MPMPYVCRTNSGQNFEACQNEAICLNRENKGFEYKPDESYSYFMQNWYTQMDWICTPTTSIDLIATFFFGGLSLGAFCISWLPDKCGRKVTLMITGPILTCAHLALLYWPNITVKVICFGVLGLFYIGKTVCLNLMYELCEKKYTPKICNVF